ncbi:hypothetical protein BJY52DRAFT_683695 [Lactarius psammicola]|nr:hypothetical protein BJY52DRAFT_683695 [Lactarius psammicola]
MANIQPLVFGAAGAVLGVVLTPIMVPAILGLFGFSAIGPVAGTAAAAWQSGIGSVAAGSLFATAQGVAMGAAVPPVIMAIGAGMGGAGGAAIAAGVGGDGDDDDEEEEGDAGDADNAGDAPAP